MIYLRKLHSRNYGMQLSVFFIYKKYFNLYKHVKNMGIFTSFRSLPRAYRDMNLGIPADRNHDVHIFLSCIQYDNIVCLFYLIQKKVKNQLCFWGMMYVFFLIAHSVFSCFCE